MTPLEKLKQAADKYAEEKSIGNVYDLSDFATSESAREYWSSVLNEEPYNKGYDKGYSDAQREAAQEIRNNYRPNR